MIPDDSTPKRVWYVTHAGYELRCQRRLHNDLGINLAAAEMILHLRKQVIEHQARIRQLEAELENQAARLRIHLDSYREVYYETTWVELESLK